MRFSSFPLWLAALLANPSLGITPQSSFGPEISAEDFGLHLNTLSGYRTAGRSDDAAVYIQAQFARLGLTASHAVCVPGDQGLQAVLHGTAPNGETVVYLANPEQPGEVAAILEIAERFMTQRPRPPHDLLFLISPVNASVLSACNAFQQAPRIIRATEMETRDASSLVRDLIELQRQGK